MPHLNLCGYPILTSPQLVADSWEGEGRLVDAIQFFQKFFGNVFEEEKGIILARLAGIQRKLALHPSLFPHEIGKWVERKI